MENNTWEFVPLNSNKNLVRCKWIFKKNRVVEGYFKYYKAQLEAKGFSQV